MSKWFIVRDSSRAIVSSEVIAIHAALLSTGQIIYFSGDEHDPGLNAAHNIDHTRIFDCSTFSVGTLTSPTSDVFCCGHCLLDDGSVLVAGGTLVFDPFYGLNDAWLYRAGSGWTKVADMTPQPGSTVGGGRWYPTLLTLPDGTGLAMSGSPNRDDSRGINNSPEVFHRYPAPGGTWTNLGNSDEVNLYPRIMVVPEQYGLTGYSVFITNGANDETKLFNPSTTQWFSLGAGPNSPLYSSWGGSAVLLPLSPADGYRTRVLVTGDVQAKIFDLGNPSAGWTPTASRPAFPGLSAPPQRNNSTAVLLPTGDVFVSGGTADGQDVNAVLAAELYMTATGTWCLLESATVPRNYHSVALLMPDGRVWTAGSNIDCRRSFQPPFNPGTTNNMELRMEIYEPWYYSLPRPTISSAPARVEWGESFQVQTPQAGAASRVVLMRAGSSTHAFDNDQRCVILDFTRPGGSTLQVTAPPDRNVAPPGYYMLFVLDCEGVPSVGRFVLLAPHVIKARKELKPELKELKEFIAEKTQVNWENKPLKAELPEKPNFEPKGNKEIVENFQQGPFGDPAVMVRLLAARIDDLERRLASGKAFIRPSQRPAVGRALAQPTLSEGEKAVLNAATPPRPPVKFDDLSPVERYTRVHNKAMAGMPMHGEGKPPVKGGHAAGKPMPTTMPMPKPARPGARKKGRRRKGLPKKMK
ncbi:MAG TPA: galactose oxidase-like domain-containing protein [Vicinamibacterales bacterium]|jgi:hypothetical protein